MGKNSAKGNMKRLAIVSCSNKKCRLRMTRNLAREDSETHTLYCVECFKNRASFSEDKPTPTPTLAKQYWEIILRQRPRPTITEGGQELLALL